MSLNLKAKIYGPYQLLTAQGQKGVEFLSVPYAAVEGSQIIVAVTDNLSQSTAGSFSDGIQFIAWPALEIFIYGSVQGYKTRLKRQFVRMPTGPMTYTIPVEEAYDNILLYARDVTGGTVVAPQNLAEFSDDSSVPFSITAMVYFSPRGGFEITTKEKVRLSGGIG